MMKNTNSNWRYPALILILLIHSNLCSNRIFAQEQKTSAKTIDNGFKCVVYLENPVLKSRSGAGQRDTLYSTGFLISDHGKIYFVTAKHTLLNRFVSKRVNDSVFITGSVRPGNKGLKFPGFVDADPSRKGFILSGDADDLVIISLQKKQYQFIRAFLKDVKPLPLSSFSTSNNLKIADTVQHVGYLVSKNKGVITKMQGSPFGKVSQFDKAAGCFTIDETIFLGTEGAPIFGKNKVVGMIITPLPSIAVRKLEGNLFKYSTSGIVVKSSVILSLLEKLQKVENQPDFNQ